ncbi:MAG: metallophosphoesterase family protein [Candidatus Gastranaerophilaceae bacterium]
MSRKRHSSCLNKIFNFVFTIVLVIITVFAIQMYSNTEVGAATLKFAQISDDHLSTLKVNKSYRLTASSADLLDDAIDVVNHTPNLDFVFFTGDIVDVPFDENYKMFFEHVKKLKYPYYAVPGNHDICIGGYISKQVYVKLMQENNKNYKFTKTYFSFTPKIGFKVIGLDNIIDTRITANGELSQEQLDFLDRELNNAGNSTVLIFMHVPLKQPFSSDSHRLLNADKMNDILNKYSNPIGIFTGHYHTTKVFHKDNIVHVSTPALISYPNAFRFVTVKNLKNKTIFEIQYMPTRLAELQKKSKLLVFHSSTYYGSEADRTVTITIEKRKNDR